jgi:radical SAM-linked protein
LDLLRTIQRIFRRTSLPVVYSKGFNPHMSTSIAQPLSVGMHSIGDYMDVEFTEELDEKCIKDSLNSSAPSGIKILEVVKVKESKEGKKVPQSMALIDAAKYSIKIKYEDTTKLQDELGSLISKDEWNISKKSKNGEKIVNIRGMVKDLKYTIANGELLLAVVVSCGSKENLSADLLAQYIKTNTSGANMEAFVDIMREEMYVKVNEELVPMYLYI